MATWDDVNRLVMAMPGTEQIREREWRAGARSSVFERPLRARDLAEIGDQAGPILGARVADEGEKLALIESDPDVFFTTSHFDGYPVVLIHLDRISPERLAEVVVEAWIATAPKRAVQAYARSAQGSPFGARDGG